MNMVCLQGNEIRTGELGTVPTLALQKRALRIRGMCWNKALVWHGYGLLGKYRQVLVVVALVMCSISQVFLCFSKIGCTTFNIKTKYS